MKTQMTKLMFAAIVIAGAITGCKKDKDTVPTPPPVVNETEVITTIKLTFTD